MEVGSLRRFNRIINPKTGRAIIVPMDHGVSDGAPRGLRNMAQAITDMSVGGADAVLLHKGLIHKARYEDHLHLGFIMHISASTSLSAPTRRCSWVTWRKPSALARMPFPSTSISATNTKAT